MMHERFEQLAPRERLLVSVCAALVLFTLVWTFVVQPVIAARAGLLERVDSKQIQLVSFQSLAANAVTNRGAQRSNAAARSNDSVVVIIDRATRNRELSQYLKRNQPDGQMGVRLRFENAPFDQLMSLLGELQNNYGMITSNASFDSVGTGMVNSSLVLTREGS
jgi:general secretion pathway protein M